MEDGLVVDYTLFNPLAFSLALFCLFYNQTEPLIPLITVLILLLRTDSAGRLHPDGLRCRAKPANNSIFLISAHCDSAALSLLNYKLNV